MLQGGEAGSMGLEQQGCVDELRVKSPLSRSSAPSDNEPVLPSGQAAAGDILLAVGEGVPALPRSPEPAASASGHASEPPGTGSCPSPLGALEWGGRIDGDDGNGGGEGSPVLLGPSGLGLEERPVDGVEIMPVRAPTCPPAPLRCQEGTSMTSLIPTPLTSCLNTFHTLSHIIR